MTLSYSVLDVIAFLEYIKVCFCDKFLALLSVTVALPIMICHAILFLKLKINYKHETNHSVKAYIKNKLQSQNG